MAAERGGTERATPAKVVVAIAVVALAIGGAAAVLVIDDGSSDSNASDAVEQVPAGADTLVRVDPGALEDPVIEDLFDGTVERIEAEARARTGDGGAGPGDDGAGPGAENGGFGPGEESPFPTTLAEIRQRIAEESDLDPTAADEIVLFQRSDGGTMADVGNDPGADFAAADQSYGATIVHADWDEEAVVEAVRNASDRPYENVTRRGATVYRPVASGETSPLASDTAPLAVLGDGEFVFGTAAAVNDTIDASRGLGDSVGGDLLAAYQRTPDGFLRSASASPNVDPALLNATRDADTGFNVTKYVEAYNDLHVTASSTYTTANGVGTEQVIVTNATDTARDVESLYEGFLAIQAGAIQQETVEQQLRSVEVRREGTDVVVSSEVTVETALEIVDWLVSLVPSDGAPMGPGGVPTGPSGLAGVA